MIRNTLPFLAGLMMIRATLLHEGYNINRTASSLGITRATLYKKLQKYQIDRNPRK